MLLQQDKLSKLEIKALKLRLHLGCSVEERASIQEVQVDIAISFLAIPVGAYTDNIDDTICYLSIIETICSSIADREFNLIEHLAAYIFDIVGQYISAIGYNDITLEVTVTKLVPSILELQGTVSFYCTGPILAQSNN